MSCITLLRSNPGRPTIKESKRFATFTVELRPTRMITNPNRSFALVIKVKLELAAVRMPFDLETAITTRH